MASRSLLDLAEVHDPGAKPMGRRVEDTRVRNDREAGYFSGRHAFGRGPRGRAAHKAHHAEVRPGVEVAGDVVTHHRCHGQIRKIVSAVDPSRGGPSPGDLED